MWRKKNNAKQNVKIHTCKYQGPRAENHDENFRVILLRSRRLEHVKFVATLYQRRGLETVSSENRHMHPQKQASRTVVQDAYFHVNMIVHPDKYYAHLPNQANLRQQTLLFQLSMGQMHNFQMLVQHSIIQKMNAKYLYKT